MNGSNDTQQLALALQPQMQLEKFAMRPADLIGQVALIQNVMKEVMKEDEHYGKIPGTNKPTLLQPGAEKLLLTFRLGPDFKILNKIEDKDFIAYTIECTLFHIPTGNRVASGIGACNSRESKYRFRYDEISTGKLIPKAYWDAKKKGDSKEMKRLLGGDGFRAAKINDQWVIATGKKVEHDNPWDYQNTILKMAAKRAKVAATLNATAASDIFTQDIEDLPPEIIDHANQSFPENHTQENSNESHGQVAGNGKEAVLKRKIKAKAEFYAKKQGIDIGEFYQVTLPEGKGLDTMEVAELVNILNSIEELIKNSEK